MYQKLTPVVLILAIILAMTTAFDKLYTAEAKPVSHKAKNIIVMISDGCGFNQIAATDYYQYGKIGAQVYEKFPFRSAMSTYSEEGGGYDPKTIWGDFSAASINPTDSAAAATALATGIKTYNAAIGVNAAKQPVKNVVERAEELGRATGVVTTVMFSHATPAGFVAHNESRGNYEAIAQEMLLKSTVDVIMGAGHPWFNEDGQSITEPNTFQYVGGTTTWEALNAKTAGADANKDGTPDPWTLIQTREQFQALGKGDTPARVCGVAQVHSTLQQSRSGDVSAVPYKVPFTKTVPTLAEMTAGALNVLDNDPDGFFLMVEGGAIDWASHANSSGRMIEEEVAFNRAVETVVAWVKKNSNWNETLLVVTGDHETGYPTGPGSTASPKPTWKPIVNNGKGVLPGMEWHSVGHTNNLIPLFAKGAGSELLKEYADECDPVRGQYLDNTEVAKLVFRLMQ